MAKRHILAFFFLLSMHATAQNYALLDTGRIVNFASNYSSQSIRIDSVFQVANATIYVNYKVVDYGGWGSSCRTILADNWLGKRAVAHTNGDYQFINAQDDSVLIRSSAFVNDTWRMCTDTGGRYVEAELISVVQALVFGVPDSIKTARLSMMDSTGAIVASHPITGTTIAWSRQHGLVKAVDFLGFPASLTVYAITGMSNPTAGKQDIGAQAIFDFSVGDTFQYRMDIPSGPGFETAWEELRILSRSNYSDSVNYTADRLYHKTGGLPPSLTIRDTLVFRFTWSALQGFSRLSYEYAHYDSTMLFSSPPYSILIPLFNGYFERIDSTRFNGHSGKRLHPYFQYDSSNQCLTMFMQPASWCIYHHYDYAEGLGLVEVYEDMACYSKYMVYFHKGSETWGTPLNWSIILGTEELETAPDITCFPNPFSGILQVQSVRNEPIESIEIYDAAGRLQAAMQDGQASVSLPTGSLAPGFYMLRVVLKGREVHMKVVRN